MIGDPASPATNEKLDASAGREASRAELRHRLPGAPSPFLEGALANPSLGPDELLLLLRNRRASDAVLARVAGNPAWLRKAEVRRQIARHPRVPLVLGRELLARLGYKDLLEVCQSPEAHPFVRRQAELRLEARLEELSSGERVTLARRAPRSVLCSLIRTDDARVLESALGNPALGEQDAVLVAGREGADPAVLTRIARHSRWGVRQSVRWALLRNARTPIPVALRLVAQLPRTELQRVAEDPLVPRIVRVGAERRLGS